MTATCSRSDLHFVLGLPTAESALLYLLMRLPPEGAHSGLSGKDDYTFRCRMVQLTRTFLIRRLNQGAVQ